MLKFAADPANLLSGLRWSPSYQAYTVRTFRQIRQVQSLPAEQQIAIEVVGQVLPFRVNNYVVDELIDWSRVPDDPIFVLTFPQAEMLAPEHFDEIAGLLRHTRRLPPSKRASGRRSDRLRHQYLRGG